MIKKVSAKSVLDSRKKETIMVLVKTKKGKFITIAPAGKSTGEHEVKSYAKSLIGDIKFINSINVEKINKLIDKFSGVDKEIGPREVFLFLKQIEKLLHKKIGGNSLFAFEASLLKAFASEKNKELYEFIGKNQKIPRPIGNSIGGGLHSKGVNGKKPDFQEFLFIGDGKNFAQSVRINKKAYKIMKEFLKSKKRNDEGAWETEKSNEQVLSLMERTRAILKRKYGLNVDIGLDVASSSFYEKGSYYYKNKKNKRGKTKQIQFIKYIIERYKILYVEDPIDENDFLGFSKINKYFQRNKFDSKRNCLIVGDDLTTTSPKRLKKAIKTNSINAIIVKPNQIGSLISVKKVIDICEKNNIRTIISHRSGETIDDTISDLCVGFGCDYIKTGVYGKVRVAKLKRLIEIGKKLKKAKK